MYISNGVNLLIKNNNAGVLIGNRVEGGTIGFMMSRAGRKGFTIIYPVGLEKLIPVSINKAAEESRHRSDLNYSMGSPCNLLPCKGVVINELAAIEILSGATTIPISAGGLGGAEGAVTMVIKGDEKQISKAIQYIESIKGASLPRDVKTGDCKDCENELCSLRGGDKPWC
jgi:hypothetical protein